MNSEPVLRLAVAALAGLAVGIEREWSGHASGPAARFAGVRTFLMVGLIGGVAGWMASEGYTPLATPLLFGAVLLVLAAYVLGTKNTGNVDGTTEVVALVVLALGLLAGVGHLAVSSGTAAVVVVALREKAAIGKFVSHISEAELRAAFQFAVLALVILPLLPEGPFGPFDGVQPRTIWTVVLIFSALNYLGYLAHRAFGKMRGYAVAGALGGLVSSTAVTITFAQRSRREPDHGITLGLGAVAASAVLVPRVLMIAWVLRPELGQKLGVAMLPALLVGLALAVLLKRRRPGEEEEDRPPKAGNPLQLGSAIKMAIAFQAVLILLAAAREYLTDLGLLGAAAFLGLTDMDALTFSMSRVDPGLVTTNLAARGILVGMIANSVLKTGAASVLGSSGYRKVVLLGLGSLATAIGMGYWFTT